MNKIGIIRGFLCLKKELQELVTAPESEETEWHKKRKLSNFRRKGIRLLRSALEAYPNFDNKAPDAEKIKWLDGFSNLVKMFPDPKPTKRGVFNDPFCSFQPSFT